MRKIVAIFAAISLLALFLSVKPTTIDVTSKVEPSSLRLQYVDRNGVPLSRTFENYWNIYERKSLGEIPPIVKAAFIVSEDKRFKSHFGVDPIAILHALVSNLASFRVVRGGSSITEQAVRMLNPRRRTLWSRLLESIEAIILELSFSKDEILEFYLNQVPLGGKARGVYGASLSLFDRDLSTLTKKESLALAVMARAPSKFSPRTKKGGELLEKRILQLGERMKQMGFLTPGELDEIKESNVALSKNSIRVDATHFLRHIQKLPASSVVPGEVIMTSINGSLQNEAKKLLDTRLKELAPYSVSNGAILAVDNDSMEVLLWINGASKSSGTDSLDAVLVPRQPGSTLKPFLYAKALEKGWTAATLIDDSPLLRGVGAGLKEYRNFGRNYYGPVRLRMALGNSLNIPAIRTIEFVGRGEFFSLLKSLGFSSLGKDPEYYGDGLALGNGEVSLYELVRAYSTLARGGLEASFKMTLRDQKQKITAKRIIRRDIASLIADILADPDARALEFGRGGLFAFPTETAVKTGTSTDFNDAWAIGFSRRFTVGVWLGNLNREPMREISGARGSVLLLRSIFSLLSSFSLLEGKNSSRPLYRDPSLIKRPICFEPIEECSAIEEFFVKGSELNGEESVATSVCNASLEIPTQGLHIADDPRVPDSVEALALTLSKGIRPKRTDWYVDNALVERTEAGIRKSMWKLAPGRHIVRAEVTIEGCEKTASTKEVAFYVR